MDLIRDARTTYMGQKTALKSLPLSKERTDKQLPIGKLHTMYEHVESKLRIKVCYGVPWAKIFLTREPARERSRSTRHSMSYHHAKAQAGRQGGGAFHRQQHPWCFMSPKQQQRRNVGRMCAAMLFPASRCASDQSALWMNSGTSGCTQGQVTD